MSPTDTLVISCGSNLKPPAPALIVCTVGLPEDVGVAEDDSAGVHVGVAEDDSAGVHVGVACATDDRYERVESARVVGKRSWLAAIVVASRAVHERLIVRC